MTPPDDATAGLHDGEREKGPSRAELVVSLVTALAVLFHDDKGDAFARVFDAVGRPDTHRINSKAFQQWLDFTMHSTGGKVVSASTKRDAVATLEAIARHGGGDGDGDGDGEGHGQRQTVWLRTAVSSGARYVDLATDDRCVVEIRPTGWRFVSDVPVSFRRPRGMLALPRPTRGAAIRLLRHYVNVESDEDFLLLVAWMVASLRSNGPFPILALVSEQGSGKSTASRVIRQLIDPNASPLRTMPRDERELAISANGSCLLAFDNVSGIPNRMSDALCRLSTGGGFSCRALFTDSDEVLFDAQRPVLLNGIDDVGTRPDLAERCIVLSLAPINESARREERVLNAALAADAPQILGALLDLSVEVMAREGRMSLARLPRMADFARLGAAVACAMGGTADTFLNAYEQNAQKLVGAAVDADPLAAAVHALLASTGTQWTGTPTELLDRLKSVVSEEVRRADTWPRAPNAMSNRLRRLAPTLRKVGIEMKERRARRREWTLCRVGDGPTSPTSTAEVAVDENDDVVGHAHARPTSGPSLAHEGRELDDDDDGLLQGRGRANGTLLGPHGYPADWDSV